MKKDVSDVSAYGLSMLTTLEHKQKAGRCSRFSSAVLYAKKPQRASLLISRAMENALLMRVSVFTDQGGRKYMEDVTEVIVEPEPGDDEPATGDGERCAGDCTLSPAVENAHGDVIFETTEVTDASCEPVKTEDQRLFVEASSLPGSPSPHPAQSNAASHSRRSVAFFAVFDGHGGREAAQFARDYLWEFMKKQRGFWSDCDREVCSAIRKGFVACHHAMWKKLRKFTQPFHYRHTPTYTNTHTQSGDSDR